MNWLLVAFAAYTLHLNAKGLVTDDNTGAVLVAVGLIVLYDWFWKKVAKGTLIPQMLHEIYAGRDWPPSWLQQKVDLLAHLDGRCACANGIMRRYVVRKTADVIRGIDRF